MTFKILFPTLLLLPLISQAQHSDKRAFGDQLLLGVHYGFSEDFVGDRSIQYEVEHFTALKAGVMLNPHLYGGIQSRFIRARNFETPAQDYYMAGVFARAYLLHPAIKNNKNRIGAFLESGFMMGNYAYENRNDVQYAYQKPGSWYLPIVLGAELRVWQRLTLEGSMNLIYNNGQNWNEYGIAYLSLGLNWHW